MQDLRRLRDIKYIILYTAAECPLCNTLSSREHIFYILKSVLQFFFSNSCCIPVPTTDNVTYYMQIFQIERNLRIRRRKTTRSEHFIYCRAQGDKSRNDTFLFPIVVHIIFRTYDCGTRPNTY